MLSHLLIMRHAKSESDNVVISDFDRRLNSRGRMSSDIIAQALSAKNYAPDVIWASSAARTRETAERLIRAIDGAQSVYHQDGFYMASAPHALELCAAEDEPDGKLMLLGHNPGWGSLFEHFSGQYHRYPTGACGVFARKDKAASWLTPEAWHFKELLLPREMMSE